MKYMKLDGPYKDYGRPDMWDNNSEVVCYVDTHTRETPNNSDKQVALLIEPRSIQRDVYLKMKDNYKNFKYVFTHDSKLLKKLPNAKPIIWGGCWCKNENPIKDKFIGMLYSHKKFTPLHKVRYKIGELYKEIENIDVYGPYKDNERIDPMIAHERYKYVVVIENYIDDIWITEKIIDAFATKTIPIYLGARDINKYFNKNGIIQVEDEKELIKTINTMLNNVEYWNDYYNDIHIQETIEENYEISKKYWNFEEWFYKTYEKEISEMYE